MQARSTQINKDKPVLVLAGFGKIAIKLAAQLQDEFRVFGIKRNPLKPKGDTNNSEGSAPTIITADLCDQASLAETLTRQLPQKIDYLVYCLTPNERSEKGYRSIYIDAFKNLLESLPNTSSLKHIIFISSTSVYHQNDRSWVNENSECKPSSFAGRILLEAEHIIRNLDINTSSVRFSGIYGGNRTQLIEKVKSAATTGDSILSSKTRLSNRIHEDDCAGFIATLLRLASNGEKLEELYLASDSCPVDLNEVIHFIAEQYELKISEQKNNVATRRGGNKKCDNRRMLNTGYQLKYPSFREGYRQA